MSVRRLVAACAAAVLLAGCAGSAEQAAEQSPAPAATRSEGAVASTAPTTAAPEPEPDGRGEPLAFAFTVHRAALDLTRAQAGDLLAGEPTTWRALGQPGGAVDVRQGTGALRAAERDPSVLAVVPASRLRPTVRVAHVAGLDPLRAPRRYPFTQPGSATAPVVTTVTVGGDVMLGRRVAGSGHDLSALRPLRRRLASADITVANLESTLSRDGAPRQGGDSFAASPQVLRPLERAGVDVVSLANNHTGDYGPRAFEATLRTLDGSRIRRVGAGRDAAEAWRPTVVEADGLRFGFVAFNAIGETPRATARGAGAASVRMPPRTGPLNAGDLRRLTRTIRTLKARVDVVIVLPHWGTQYTNRPEPAQRRVADAMVDAGADVVVGGHPHWVQGVQLRRGVPVVHSLGNLVFDMDFSQQTEEGVLAELVFWDGRLRGLDLTPYVIGPDFTPRLAAGPRARRTLDRIWATSDGPLRAN